MLDAPRSGFLKERWFARVDTICDRARSINSMVKPTVRERDEALKGVAPPALLRIEIDNFC